MKVYQLETTNACNLKCHFCPKFKDWAQRKIGFLKLDLVDRIDWSETEYVELQLTGEPTLHKELPALIKKLQEKGVKVGFSTNGTQMKKLAEVIDLADCVTVNNDAYRDPVFEDKENVYVQSLGVDFPVEDYDHYFCYPKGKNFCSTPAEFITVHWDGDIVPCCKAHGKDVVFGNLYNESMKSIVESAPRKDFLQAIKDGKDNKLCEFCQYPNPHNIHEKLRPIWERQ